MRIVIDMQGAQSDNRFHGIGRYTMGFAQAIVRNRGEHEIILALSGLFPETIEPIRAAFDDLLPQENIRVWHAIGSVREVEPGNESRRETAELIREAFLSSLQPDVIHISSLFEGYVDDAVVSIGRFDTKTPVSVTLYNLIPLLNPDHYLKDPLYKNHYLRKIEFLKKAAIYLAISESSRQEGIRMLGRGEDLFFNILGDTEPCFQQQSIFEATAVQIKNKYSISRPFVLYTGACAVHKNLPRLIDAYAALPADLRVRHQLVFAGKMSTAEISRLRQCAKDAGLKKDELLFTGYVSDAELVQLYNLCILYVFPSWHEGFGLPALEAMRCGVPVIAANTSSLPEIIGLNEALFDPFDVGSISSKMAQVLQDEDFRNKLKRHAIEQAKKFSWNETARRAIEAWNTLKIQQKYKTIYSTIKDRKPRLAFVSPLPPEKTGIADYSAELLPEFMQHYEITAIVQQERIDNALLQSKVHVRDVAWFRTHAQDFDRVLYHFGNSPFHSHMFDLLAKIPGTVVLHDFYISGVIGYVDTHGVMPHVWAQTLLQEQGWHAVTERFQHRNDHVVMKYPCNLAVLQQAQGVIVHSEHSRRLAQTFYGCDAANNWFVIPHLRKYVDQMNKALARKRLGIAVNDYVVCSFGMLGPIKLNHRLLKAWLQSSLSSDASCRLVFVGENDGGDYGRDLLKKIASSSVEDRITITGWVDVETFRQWLCAADVAVQLRTLSRGETSGTVLDCMNYGLATIINAHASMAEFPTDAVWMLPDEFTDEQLMDALGSLRQDEAYRKKLGEMAREYIRVMHSPKRCAEKYVQAIEAAWTKSDHGLHGLIQALSRLTPSISTAQYSRLASVLSIDFPPNPHKRQLLLDISALIQIDIWTGIQRVTRALLREIVLNPPKGWRVEPVYATAHQPGYRYARKFMCKFLGIPVNWVEDEFVDVYPGDVFFGLDLAYDVVLAQQEKLQFWHSLGIKIYFLVHDLLPVTMPEVFPDSSMLMHQDWLHAISSFDGAVCVSRAVVDELLSWLKRFGSKRERPYTIHWSHNGADINSSAPSLGMPADASKILAALNARLTFLMVGTIEPRKGYLQTLHAFSELWQQGVNVNLVIVGSEGWKHIENNQRRDIPQTVHALRNHPELGNRLFWLEGISDEYLEKVYAASTCLIAASYGEGFGLPLIEAAQHKLPLIVRDIPVFREVAGEHAFYFHNDKSPATIAEAVKNWLELYRQNNHPKSDNMPYLTWKESATNLLEIILKNKWHYKIKIDDFIRPGKVYNHLDGLWQRGWSHPERNFRWNDGDNAVIKFNMSAENAVSCRHIRLKFNTLGQQKLSIVFNGENIFDGLMAGENQDLLLQNVTFRNGANELVFNLPNARQLDNGDKRFLAIAMKEFEIMETSK